MTTTLADELKLEIGLPDAPGDNLITNTSGQYGAWQWAPSSGTDGVTIAGDADARTITATRDGTAGFTGIVSDYLPVTAGMYANARVDLAAITSGHKVTLAIQFYDSAYQIDSFQYSSPTTNLDTLAFSSVQVPADVAWAQLYVILDKVTDPQPGGGSANAGASVTYTRAMLTELSTTGTPSIVTTNLMPNGGFQYVLTGWEAGTNIGSITRHNSNGEGVFYYLRGYFVDGVSLSNGEYSYMRGPNLDVVEAGENYSLRVDTYWPSGLPSDQKFTTGVLYRWYDASGDQIGSDVHLTDGSTEPGWHFVWRILTAPAGATRIRVFPFARHSGSTLVLSDAWYFQADSISFVKSSVLTPYFDGDTPDTSSAVYDWTGTPGNSPSTRTSIGAVDYVETDEQYLDILPGAAALTIERAELDISTFTGRLVDVALSPARAGSVVRPGRRFKVSALGADGVTWRRLFTGTLGPASVAYEPLEDERRAARDPGRALNINVTGSGNESVLAQAARPAVTATPAHLTDLALAGAGVPWNVDGNTGVVSAVSSLATSENATALDQVALTRDTVSGLARVNAEGTLEFFTTPPATIAGTLDEEAYTADGLTVSYDTTRVINSVTIVRMIRATDGSTEERQHGPYENSASIKAWGRQSATVTIASAPNDTADADVRAAAILAANAEPELIIEEASVNSADVRAHAFYELYDLLHLQAATIDGAIEHDARIVSIRHEITTERRRHANWGNWRTTYGFMMAGAIASPAILPPLAAASESGWQDLPLALGFIQASGPSDKCQFRGEGPWTIVRGHVEAEDGAFSAGATQVVANLPEGYRPRGTGTSYNAMTALCGYHPEVEGREYVGASGNIIIHPAAGSPVSGYMNLDFVFLRD